MGTVSEILMIKILPLIIISSTIPISEEKIITLSSDYSIEAQECLEKNKVYNSQDTSNILYDLILEQLLKEDFDLSHPK
jgi:hypothetical protein